MMRRVVLSLSLLIGCLMPFTAQAKPKIYADLCVDSAKVLGKTIAKCTGEPEYKQGEFDWAMACCEQLGPSCKEPISSKRYQESMSVVKAVTCQDLIKLLEKSNASTEI